MRGISNISISLGMQSMSRFYSCRQCQYRVLSIPLSSSCSSASHPSKQRGQDRQCENDDVHGGSPSDVLAPVRHSYKKCWRQLASKLPLSSSGSRAGGNTRSSYSLHAVVPLINIFFCPLLALRISPGPTAQYIPGRQTNFASNTPKRDRVHRRSSARACAFRFVSTIRPKVKS